MIQCTKRFSRPARLARGVENVADAVEVVREWVMARANDAEPAVEGTDAGAQLAWGVPMSRTPKLDANASKLSPSIRKSSASWVVAPTGMNCSVAADATNSAG